MTAHQLSDVQLWVYDASSVHGSFVNEPLCDLPVDALLDSTLAVLADLPLLAKTLKWWLAGKLRRI